ncbi:MAG: NAD(P)/FAD-dependent oxidoreductase [Xenococcaceae cyanobacterium]
MVGRDTYDVAILGTGIGGTMLSAILARNGLRVVMLDGSTHPKFAIGESTTPDTSIRMKLMARRFGVPEIANLANFYKLRDKVSSGSGVKRGFSFLYHHEGLQQQPTESQQLPTLTAPFGPDCHLFRQDTDAYMMTVAMQYGAAVHQNTRIAEIEFSDTGVQLRSDKGKEFKARYLVDATGMRSILARKFDLREKPSRYQTNTRTLFTHMVNVKPYDQISSAKSAHKLPYPFAQTTLHHVFEGGWFWVIPFDNHPNTTNSLCSVGLTLNRDIHPKGDLSPEEEFAQFVQRFPSVAKQFEDAKAVRPWIASDRIQWSSTQMVGDRWALLPSSACFIDPLFAGGLSITCAGIAKLSDLLLEACASDLFFREKFSSYEESVTFSMNHHDQLVSSGYFAFSQGFELWNAWFRVWCLGNIISATGQIRLYCKYLATKDPEYLKAADLAPYSGALASSLNENKAIFDAAVAELDAVRNQQQSATEASHKILTLLGQSDIAPKYLQLDNPERRYPSTFTLLSSARLVMWFKFIGPKQLRRYYCDYSLLIVAIEALKYLLGNTIQSLQRAFSLPRDLFAAWNNDWKLNPTTVTGGSLATTAITRDYPSSTSPKSTAAVTKELSYQ